MTSGCDTRGGDGNLWLVQELVEITESAGIRIWFFGGYGLDALQGRSTRGHADVDFFAREDDCARLLEALNASGYNLGLRETGHSHLSRHGVHCDCVTWRPTADGGALTDTGETGAFRWPDGAFPEEPNGNLAGRPVRAASYEALYCLKAGFACYDPTTSPRDKDHQDLAIICAHVTDARRRELESMFHPVPGSRRRFPAPQGG